MQEEQYSWRPLLIIGILFGVFGFVTWLGSILIPYLRIACELNAAQSYLVAFAFYISYTLMALPASGILKRTGLKSGMALGLLLMSVGALIFIPAATTRMYALFLTGLFVQGAGLTILQTAANPYVTILGPSESAARRISVMGICNGLAGIMAPLILGSVILKDADGLEGRIREMAAADRIPLLEALAQRAIGPYAIMAGSLMLLALVVRISGLPEPDRELEKQDTTESVQGRTIWQYPQLIFGVMTLFLYVGVEVIAVDTVAGYAAANGVGLSKASFFASLTLANMLIGYFIGILCIPRWISQRNALRISAMAGFAFSLIALSTGGMVSVVCISMLGLANALIWPSIWPLALEGLGRFTKTGSSLLIMAVGGGAILPLVYGLLADRWGVRFAYGMVLPCYLMIYLYATRLHQLRRMPWSKEVSAGLSNQEEGQ